MITWLLHPCLGCPVTQNYGENPDWYPRTNGHNGIDYGGTEATVIRAAHDGTVLEARDGGYDGYGIHVTLWAEDGSRTIYGHLSALNVIEGQHVKAGDALGQMGNTGRSTGIHLHFEYRPGTGNIAVDPAGLIVDQIPSQTALCLAKCLTPVRIRSGPSYNRSVIGMTTQDTEYEALDFLPYGWIRLSMGYCAVGDDSGRWFEFMPIRPAEFQEQAGKFKAL